MLTRTGERATRFFCNRRYDIIFPNPKLLDTRRCKHRKAGGANSSGTVCDLRKLAPVEMKLSYHGERSDIELPNLDNCKVTAHDEQDKGWTKDLYKAIKLEPQLRMMMRSSFIKYAVKRYLQARTHVVLMQQVC